MFICILKTSKAKRTVEKYFLVHCTLFGWETAQDLITNISENSVEIQLTHGETLKREFLPRCRKLEEHFLKDWRELLRKQNGLTYRLNY